MSSIASELLDLADQLDRAKAAHDQRDLAHQAEKLRTVANETARSWSGSYLGYQSRVYYKGFHPVPPGARFSQEFGLMRMQFAQETIGEWREYRFKDVIDHIYAEAGHPDLPQLRAQAAALGQAFGASRRTALSLIGLALDARTDSYLTDLKQEISQIRILTAQDFFTAMVPQRQFMSRDSVAMEQGIQSPPHDAVLADLAALNEPQRVAEELAVFCRSAASHISTRERVMATSDPSRKLVFIGHGRSHLWREVKDFVHERLHLGWEEFNRVPTAGIATSARLLEMLDNAAIALLILTGEDEQADGRLHARLNVVHEAGLFQGRLGFTRALVLIEEGCEEFSNIEGLGQIRFSRGNISTAFEEIRRVLEREGIVSAS